MERLTGNRGIVIGLAGGLILAACAGASFPFRHYIPELPNQDCYDRGILKGAKPTDDLSMKTCQPTDGDQFKCAVLQTPEFQKLKKSHLDLQNKLMQCQRDLAACR